MLLALGGLVAGCTGPSLRALNAREAKIDVYEDGRVEVLGERVPMAELNEVIRHSATGPREMILVRLNGNPQTEAFLRLRKQVVRQMSLAEHRVYNFVSTPLATVQTYDPQTRRLETLVDHEPIGEMTKEEELADIQQLIADEKAYREGTYVSEAVNAQPVSVKVGVAPESMELKDAPKATQSSRKGSGSKQEVSQEELKKTWQRRHMPVRRR